MLLAGLCLAACQNTDAPRVRQVEVPPTALERYGAPAQQQATRLRQTLDPKTGKVLREWSVLPSGSKHGVERVWRADGSREWEKGWSEGRPSGVWRSWYATGQLRSECFYSGAGVERTLTHWYENGQRRMQGPAIEGVRTGRWQFWFANGALAEEGDYEQGVRKGDWKVRSSASEEFRLRTEPCELEVPELSP